jgi:hypothetical protein
MRDVLSHPSFLETNVPLLVLIEAAKAGNEKEVEEYALVFTEHANKLVEVSIVLTSSQQFLASLDCFCPSSQDWLEVDCAFQFLSVLQFIIHSELAGNLWDYCFSCTLFSQEEKLCSHIFQLHVKVLTFSLTYLCYTFHKLSLVV